MLSSLAKATDIATQPNKCEHDITWFWLVDNHVTTIFLSPPAANINTVWWSVNEATQQSSLYVNAIIFWEHILEICLHTYVSEDITRSKIVSYLATRVGWDDQNTHKHRCLVHILHIMQFMFKQSRFFTDYSGKILFIYLFVQLRSFSMHRASGRKCTCPCWLMFGKRERQKQLRAHFFQGTSYFTIWHWSKHVLLVITVKQVKVLSAERLGGGTDMSGVLEYS